MTNTAQKISHTPGPWIVGSDGTSVLTNSAGRADDDISKPFPVVVNTNSGYDAMEYAEAAANARLIAEAPVLVSALRRVLEVAEEAMQGDCDQWGHEMVSKAKASLALARAALAKAVQS